MTYVTNTIVTAPLVLAAPDIILAAPGIVKCRALRTGVLRVHPVELLRKRAFRAHYAIIGTRERTRGYANQERLLWCL